MDDGLCVLRRQLIIFNVDVEIARELFRASQVVNCEFEVFFREGVLFSSDTDMGPKSMCGVGDSLPLARNQTEVDRARDKPTRS